jgi:phage/plasmid-like protein (TIGR03299 family)
MSHMIMENDHAFYGGNTAAWHGLGTVIEDDVVSGKQALEYAEMDWTVSKRPLHTFFDGERIAIDNKKALMRDDTGEVLSIVGNEYEIVQNADAFGFLDEMLGGPDLRFHTAGSLYNGRKVWALARLDRDIMIGGDPDEKVDPFIALATSHDGSLPVSVWMTPIRIVCQNTLTYSLGKAKRCWKGRHTRNVMNRADEARTVLGMTNVYFDTLQEIGDRLITKNLTPKRIDDLISALLPMPEGKTEEDEGRGTTIIQNRREAIRDALAADDLANVKHTAWGFLQAVGDWDDHIRFAKSDDKRADRVLFGSNAYKQRALDLAIAA